ncbi:hypothetical protein SPURM210S_02069 [Streptomyces purpurascens]
MTDWMVTTTRIGRSIGASTERQMRHCEAPSRAAASSTSAGTARIPAYTVTITNGKEHHTTSSRTRKKALIRPYVHEWSPRPSIRFTGPKSGSKRNSQTVEPVTAGVAHAPSAASISASRGTARTRVRSTARAQPTASVETTQAAANSTVASSTCQNCGSPNSSA